MGSTLLDSVALRALGLEDLGSLLLVGFLRHGFGLRLSDRIKLGLWFEEKKQTCADERRRLVGWLRTNTNTTAVVKRRNDARRAQKKSEEEETRRKI